MSVKDYFCKNRKIQAYLVVIFMVLFFLSSVIIVRMTYRVYERNIERQAYLMVGQFSDHISDEVMRIRKEVKLILDIIEGSIEKNESISNQGVDFTNFIINILKNDSYFTSLSMVAPSGEYLAVFNLEFLGDLQFHSKPLEEIPKESKYLIKMIRQNGDSLEEIREYVNVDGVVLDTESIVPPSYNFKKDFWTSKVLEESQLYWSESQVPKGMDQYRMKGDYGDTVSNVIKNSSGNVFAIVTAGLTLKDLSDFILDEKIYGGGSVFIVDPDWDIKLPRAYGSTPDQLLKKELLKEGYEEFIKNEKREFSIVKSGKEYLFFVRDSMKYDNDKSYIVSIISHSDLFRFLSETQMTVRFLSIFIIILAGVAVYFASRYFSKPIVLLAREVDRIRNFDFSKAPSIKSKIVEIIDLETSIDAMRSAIQSFGRYVPKEVVRGLIKCGKGVHLGGERAEITIVFSDVENFTTISEMMPIEILMRDLFDYFDVISKIILGFEGIIDKYMGDGLMAFWGAPLKVTDHAEKACLTCLHCLSAIKSQKKWNTRFGIHIGEVIVGNVGTAERMNYTVIGDVVNAASRLEGINKEYHTSIIISEEVFKKIGPQFVTRPIDFVAVKGKRQKLKIFELLGTRDGELAVSLEQMELTELFTEAYTIWEEGRLEEAFQCFLEIEKKFPLDIPTKKYLDRLKKD